MLTALAVWRIYTMNKKTSAVALIYALTLCVDYLVVVMAWSWFG